VTPLVCSLAGQTETVQILPDTRAARLYGTREAHEKYYCNYGLNPEYRAAIERAGLRTSGVGANGEVRIAELVGHPFFIATLFLPQMSPQPHPLLNGFAAAMGSAK